MVAKTAIIERLGEAALLRPEQVNAALAANERVKYRFALLQAARGHADDPGAATRDLRTEREAAGVDEPDLDAVASGARLGHDGYFIPGAERIHEAIERDIDIMLAPLAEHADAAQFRARLEQLVSAQRPRADRVSRRYVGAVTHARPEQGDSLHLLVMDVHKALNAVQRSLARESVDGAQVYGIDDDDRALVRAFMAGVNATAPLKFDHPGLGTTATRSGDALLIQNDIGTTDAHVLVLRVRELQATVTYTDVHRRRASFFKSLCEGAGFSWEEDRSRGTNGLGESDRYELCTGRFEATDRRALEQGLRFLGSRIVFLIDWNKARKRLRLFLGTREALAVLRWAADHEHGHRGFLELGGERLVLDALEHAGTAPARFGIRLDRVLGRETVLEHLKVVLRTASQGLLEGRSVRLVRDEIKADLLERLHSAEQGFFALLGDQAALAADLGGAVRDGLLAAQAGADAQALEATAQRAKLWETRGDELVMQVREAMPHAAQREFFSRLSHEMDDVSDHLEEAAWLLPLLLAVDTPAALVPELLRQAGGVLESTRRLVSCIESARHVQRGGAREDLHDFLEAVDRVVTLERDADAGERAVTLALVTGGADPRQLHLLSLLSKCLEKAADAVARSALMLRDHVMVQMTPR